MPFSFKFTQERYNYLCFYGINTDIAKYGIYERIYFAQDLLLIILSIIMGTARKIYAQL